MQFAAVVEALELLCCAHCQTSLLACVVAAGQDCRQRKNDKTATRYLPILTRKAERHTT